MLHEAAQGPPCFLGNISELGLRARSSLDGIAKLNKMMNLNLEVRTFSNNLISHGNGINLRPTAQTGHTTLTFSVQLFIAKAEWRRWWTTTNEGRSELTKGWEEDDDDDGEVDLSSCALRFLAGSSSLALFIALRMRRKRWIHSQLGNTLLDCS